MSFSPEDLARTTPILFFTRWITHVCAPVFLFTAGIGAFLRLDRPGATKAQLSRFLLTRGVWLILIELTVMRLAFNFSFEMRYPVLLLVLWALGVSMIALAALIYLPRRVLAAASLAVIILHNSSGLRAGVAVRRVRRRLERAPPAGGVCSWRDSRGCRLSGDAVDCRDGPGFLRRADLSSRAAPAPAAPAEMGNASHHCLRAAASCERVRRSRAVVGAAIGDIHTPLVSEDDEVSALAGLSAHDDRSGAFGARVVRSAPARGSAIRSSSSVACRSSIT